MSEKGTNRQSRREGTPERRAAARADADTSRRSAAESRTAAQQPRRIPVLAIAIAVAVFAIVLFAGRMCSQASSIDVTLNGSQYTLRGDKNMQTAIKTSGWPVNPGDLISLQGNVLKRSAGHPFLATVNGVETVDPDFRLHNGDVITLTDGGDIVEDYDHYETPVPYNMSITGLGAIHTFTSGTEGVLETRTGLQSGEVVEKQTVDPQDANENRYDPDTNGDKVIALTFDGGPSVAHTRRILEILAENDAKATFFCCGEFVKDEGAEIVHEEAEQGHQVCSHGYNNALSVNGDPSTLPADEQREQVESGYQALADALGEEPCHVVRLGATDMAADVANNVFDLIDAEIGWTLDTGDWVGVGEDQIYDVLMMAEPGSIIRMHDAGQYQDATVAALERALPKLAKRGYTFVTIDEMMQY